MGEDKVETLLEKKCLVSPTIHLSNILIEVVSDVHTYSKCGGILRYIRININLIKYA